MAEEQQQQQQQQQQQTPWYQGKLDDEGVGYLQNRGLHDKPLETVALETIKAHREATKLIGVPQNELVRLPKDAKDEAGWRQVHQRLGAPTDAAGYDFSGVKTADGKEIDKALTDTLRATAFARGLSKDAAVEVAKSVQKHLDNQAAAEAVEKKAAIDKSKADLKTNWGPQHDANMVIARNAAGALGVTPQEVDALENVIGYDRVMEMFRSIGTKIGEDRFLRNPNNQDKTGLMTREQAIARKAELMADTQWKTRYLGGGAAENREFQALLAIIG